MGKKGFIPCSVCGTEEEPVEEVVYAYDERARPVMAYFCKNTKCYEQKVHEIEAEEIEHDVERALEAHNLENDVAQLFNSPTKRFLRSVGHARTKEDYEKDAKVDSFIQNFAREIDNWSKRKLT